MTKKKLHTKRAFSIDEIYQRVKDYELVLTEDFRLARGLNKRLDEPRVGHFATTPRNLVRDHYPENLSSKEDLFKSLIRHAGLNWKRGSHVLENILDCWSRTGAPENILEYQGFSSDVVEEVLGFIQDEQSVYSALEDYSLEEEKIAVIAPDHFDMLSRSVFPPSYEEIVPFSEEKYELREFDVFSSQAEMIEALRGTIDREDASKYAVVFESSSGYFELLKTALLVDEIPFNFQIRLSREPGVKLFLSLLRKSLNQGELAVKDVRAISSNFDLSIPIDHDEKYLSSVEDGGVAELQRIFNTDNSTFSDVAKEFEEKVGELPGEFTELLGEIGLWEKQLTENSLNLLNFYLKQFPNFLDRGDENGVQLVNFSGASYVDRPFVFHLGMDSGWSRKIPEHPWVNEQRAEKRSFESFSILTQSGKNTRYLVQNEVAGEEVTPSPYFQEYTDGGFSKFTDLKSEFSVPRNIDEKGGGFEKENYEVSIVTASSISATDLNSFVKSPKEYFFSSIVSEPEKVPLKLGNLLHEFAEFYVNHPDFVNKQGLGGFAEEIIEELEPLLSEYEMPAKRTEVMVGLKNLVRFLSGKSLKDRDYSGFSKKDYENYFCTRYDRELNKSLTELSFCNTDKGVSGRVDLLLESKIIDFKSSRQSPSSKKLLKQSRIEDPPKKPNFQPKVYLSQLRTEAGERKLDILMLYFLSNLDAFLSGRQNNDDIAVNLTYYPTKFAETVPDREAFEYLIEGLADSNDRYKTLDLLGYDSYSEFFEKNAMVDTRIKDEALESNLLDEFVDYTKRTTGKEYKYIKKGCKSTFKQLVEFRRRNLFQDDLNNFEEFVNEQIDLINKYKRSSFPVGDVEYDDLHYKDLIIDE